MPHTVHGGLRYAPYHTWAHPGEGGDVRVGITGVAASFLGDAVYLELPPEGTRVAGGEAVGLIESSHVLFEVISPLSGVVLDVNHSVADFPEKVTSDPVGEGWLFSLRGTDSSELDALMDEGEYDKMSSGGGGSRRGSR